MQFSISTPHRYLVGFESIGDAKDARFRLYATGDLDCDGILSTFSRTGHVKADGEIEAEPMQLANEFE